MTHSLQEHYGPNTMPLHGSKIMPKADELEEENCNLDTKPFAFKCR